MAKSGLTHIDVGPELTRTEWESEETHALINGTAFPGSPVERQLFYRNDLHEWYIYNGTDWVSLQGAGGGMQVHDNTYHNPDYEEEGVVATQIETHRATAVHTQDQPPASHGNAAHSPDFAADADLDAHIADEAAPVHGSAAAATANKLIHRDAAGRAKIVAPAASDDIAQKAQADAVQTNLDSHKDAATGVHGVGGSTVESASGSQAKVDAHKDLTTGVHGAGGNTLWHGGLTNIVDKTHLSQDFGASAERLRNVLVAPIAGEIVRMIGCGASPFSAVINGAPTATSVVYDGELKESMLIGLSSGAEKWGRIILHNTTRSNSRKIVSVNVTTNTITTESSTDDWADDDVITCQSQTNTTAGYFDVDVSAEVPATTDAIFLFTCLDDTEGNQDNSRYVMFHPYEVYDQGKRQWINANLANIKGQGVYPLKILSQKFTMWMASGCVTVNIILTVKAEVEYADT